MFARVALAVAVLAVLLGGYLLGRPPTFVATPRPLAWSPGPLDAGFTPAFTVAGVELGSGINPDVPMLYFAAIVRPDAGFIATDEASAFLAVEHRAPELYALGELQVEGPGPTLELFVSHDDGRSFVHQASLPKPHYLASFERWRVDGAELEIAVWLDDEVVLSESWRRPVSVPLAAAGFEPVASPGRYCLRSKDGGRRWRLERR